MLKEGRKYVYKLRDDIYDTLISYDVIGTKNKGCELSEAIRRGDFIIVIVDSIHGATKSSFTGRFFSRSNTSEPLKFWTDHDGKMLVDIDLADNILYGEVGSSKSGILAYFIREYDGSTSEPALKDKCPICGSLGTDLVFKFYCSNSGCQNFKK